MTPKIRLTIFATSAVIALIVDFTTSAMFGSLETGLPYSGWRLALFAPGLIGAAVVIRPGWCSVAPGLAAGATIGLATNRTVIVSYGQAWNMALLLGSLGLAVTVGFLLVRATRIFAPALDEFRALRPRVRPVRSRGL